MNRKNLLKSVVVLLTPLLMLVSCQDDWDAHYYAEVTEKSDLNLFEYIKSKPELSIFTQMLEKTGYDKVLSENLTYTVWAPTNASFNGFDLNDDVEVMRTVRNHITRFSTPTSGITARTMLMLNNKLLVFARSGSGFTLEGRAVKQSDIAVKNGMLHILEDYVPYINSIWEYIAKADGIDSIRNYLNSLTRLVFDVDASFMDGVLMDSVFREANQVLDNLAAINREDSTYTALLPTDQAWTAAYQRVFPFFKTLEEDGGLHAQVTNSRWVVARDLFFNGKVSAPFQGDSVRTAYGTVLTNASQIFPASAPEINSNGVTYITDQLNHKPTDSWFRPIRVEAENPNFGRSAGNYELTTFSSIGTGYDISGGFYINARATSTLSTARLFVNFPIPNTLSAKYNVYCVFVPLYITDTLNLRSYKVRFSLNYDYVPGVKRDSVWVAETGFTKIHTQAKQFITDPKEVTKVLVLENYEFPFANVTRGNRGADLLTGDRIRVGLRVENAAGTTASERLNFSRDIRIDSIILEPVEE